MRDVLVTRTPEASVARAFIPVAQKKKTVPHLDVDYPSTPRRCEALHDEMAGWKMKINFDCVVWAGRPSHSILTCGTGRTSLAPTWEPPVYIFLRF